jgi:hypothetical protein
MREKHGFQIKFGMTVIASPPRHPELDSGSIHGASIKTREQRLSKLLEERIIAINWLGKLEEL